MLNRRFGGIAGAALYGLSISSWSIFPARRSAM